MQSLLWITRSKFLLSITKIPSRRPWWENKKCHSIKWAKYLGVWSLPTHYLQAQYPHKTPGGCSFFKGQNLEKSKTDFQNFHFCAHLYVKSYWLVKNRRPESVLKEEGSTYLYIDAVRRNHFFYDDWQQQNALKSITNGIATSVEPFLIWIRARILMRGRNAHKIKGFN